MDVFIVTFDYRTKFNPEKTISMKHYFAFTLTGKKLLSVWLLFLVLFIIPYGIIIRQMTGMQSGDMPPFGLVGGLIILVFIAFIIAFFITKLMIENLQYKETNFEFNGSFGEFVGKVLLGSFLTMITLGVYSAWFVRNMHRFFVDNTRYKNEAFSFKGKGSTLFVILLLTLIVPMAIVMGIIISQTVAGGGETPVSLAYIQPIITWIVMIPYLYLAYKWMVNVNFKTYNISWDTDFWNACGKFFLELFLSIITLGIYAPLAYVKLYAYFTRKTVVKTDGEVKKRFGFEEDNMADFLFMWGQILLTIITLGFYYPWAMCKMGTRFLSRTFIDEK